MERRRAIKFCVRGTAGGNLLDVPYDVSARTASVKCPYSSGLDNTRVCIERVC